MTPRYTWTPASEPPDTNRRVLTWIVYPDGDDWQDFGRWSAHHRAWSHSMYVTHWRDVSPPDVEAPQP